MTKNSISVELVAVEDIKPYEKNAKIHTDDQVDKLAKLIQEYGWTQPIVVDKDYVIIVGHGRRLAAIKLGFDKVPVVVRRDLSDAGVRALRLADNKVVSQLYDEKLFAEEMIKLRDDEDGAFFNLVGLEEKELEMLGDNEVEEMDLDQFVDDVGEAVEEQKRENEAKSEEIGESMAPVADALGFKRITVNQSRRLRDFIVEIEGRTGKNGAESLLQFLESALK